MKTQVRIALIVLIAALAVGWLSLRNSNHALAEKVASSGVKP